MFLIEIELLLLGGVRIVGLLRMIGVLRCLC